MLFLLDPWGAAASPTPTHWGTTERRYLTCPTRQSYAPDMALLLRWAKRSCTIPFSRNSKQTKSNQKEIVMTERIGFVGVGRMGANMARHLKDVGYPETAVYDARPE